MDDVFSANTGHLRWSANIPRTRNSLSRFKKNMAFPRCRFSFDASAPAVRVKAHTVTLPSIFYFLKKREVSPYWYLSNSLQCIQNVCSGEAVNTAGLTLVMPTLNSFSNSVDVIWFREHDPLEKHVSETVTFHLSVHLEETIWSYCASSFVWKNRKNRKKA